MASSQSRDAAAADKTELNALGERPAVYLTRPSVGIGSDKPLFASRRKTAGLNPSSIPVRSDALDRSKEASDSHNEEVGAGQRRFLRTGAARTLKGAFEAAAEIMDGSQEQNPEEEEGKEEQHQREYEAQAKHASPSFKRPTPLLRGGGTSVPGFYNPTRSRRRARNSSAGLTAATAGAPNGLKEAYQRVADAEFASAMAREESGDRSEGEWTAYHYTYPDRSRYRDQTRAERLRNTASPDIAETLLGEVKGYENMETAGVDNAERNEMRVQHLLNSTATIKGSPQPAEGTKTRDTGANYFDDKENNTTGSDHTAVSGISSIIADETDDSFGRLLSTYAKDKQRLHGALRSDKVFSRVGESGGLSSEDLERRDITDKAADDNVAGRETPDPPVQIPRDWGRKARHGTEWLERIVGTGGKEGLHAQTADTERDSVDWLAAAENIPLPSIEDEPTLLAKSQLQVEANPQAGPRKTSIDRIREREEPTLLTQGSTPHQNRSTLLDTIREREIESLKDRAVTTSRLGEIKERTSKESLRSRTSSEEKPDYKTRDRGGSVRSEESSSHRETKRNMEDEEIKDNKNSASDAPIPVMIPPYADGGEQIPFTPITVFKSSQQFGRSNHDRQSSDANDKKSDIDGRDSRDVLRRLARATSNSPKTTDYKQKASDDIVAQEDLEENSVTPTLPKSLEFEGQSKGDAGRAQPTPSFHFRGPGAWIDTPAPQSTSSDPGSPSSDYDVDNEISALGLRDFIRGPSSSPLYTRSGGLKGRPSKPDTIPRRRQSEPVIPTTRRQIEAANAKLEKEVVCNDTDLSSLFDFHPDDADNTYAAIPMGNATHASDRPRPLTDAERERQREMLVYECLNRRLRTLQTEIAEAKRGIEGLESKMTQNTETVWIKKPRTVKASDNNYTVTISIPGKEFVQSFVHSLAFDRRWRWLRYSFYAWCFFWLYATVEFLFYIHTLPPLYSSGGDDGKLFGIWEYDPLCYPHPWTTLLQLTRPITWIWANVLRLEPLGEPLTDDWFKQYGPWRGSFVRRVFEWQWELTPADCKPLFRDRNAVYQIWTMFMRALNFNA